MKFTIINTSSAEYTNTTTVNAALTTGKYIAANGVLIRSTGEYQLIGISRGFSYQYIGDDHAIKEFGIGSGYEYTVTDILTQIF